MKNKSQVIPNAKIVVKNIKKTVTTSRRGQKNHKNKIMVLFFAHMNADARVWQHFYISPHTLEYYSFCFMHWLVLNIHLAMVLIL